MDAEVGRERPTPSTQGRLDPRYCSSFNKKHLLSTHCQCTRNYWTPGPVLFMTPAALLLSRKSRLRPSLESRNLLLQEAVQVREHQGGGRAVSSQSTSILWPESLRGHRRDLGSSAHRWDGMGPGQLCPFYIFNK